MTFLINLIFSRLEKFDGPIFERVYIQVGGGGAYIRDVHWITDLEGVYSRSLYILDAGMECGLLMGFYGIYN